MHFHGLISLGRERFPDEEGIKTFRRLRLHTRGRRERFPDEEGIKTSTLRTLSRPALVARDSLMKKGLRPDIPSGCPTVAGVARDSLMKKGLRPQFNEGVTFYLASREIP